ncbi:MAG TPA: hypothetical protein PKA60_01195 [Candidatus Paceibacterota bacterium]|nr:hypothetical protein [Candidatus Paceibacterota bacterium]
MKILGQKAGYIISAVEQFIAELSDILTSEGQARECCGYLTIMDTATTNGTVMLISQIGICPPDKWEKYFRFSQEKAARLQLKRHDISSWQSRNEVLDQYGGAIRTTPGWLILSFSGLPELADEALMLYLAVQLGWMPIGEAMSIASISNNNYFQKLCGAAQVPIR